MITRFHVPAYYSVVTVCTIRYDIKALCLSPTQCIYGFRMSLRINTGKVLTQPLKWRRNVICKAGIKHNLHEFHSSKVQLYATFKVSSKNSYKYKYI